MNTSRTSRIFEPEMKQAARFLAFGLLFVFLLAGICQAANEGILLAAFGSSHPQAARAYEQIEQAYRQAFPEAEIEWAYTSGKIRKKLAQTGKPVNGVKSGLNALAAKGARNIRIQSLHIFAGEEFEGLARAALLAIKASPGKFDSVILGRPLLESQADARKLARAFEIDPDEILVLIGHGNEKGLAGLAQAGAEAVFRSENPDIACGSIESDDFDSLQKKLAASGKSKIRLAPLLLVYGEHAANDIAGFGKASWLSRLREADWQVETDLKGLGERPQVADIFIEHTKESKDDLMREPGKK